MSDTLHIVRPNLLASSGATTAPISVTVQAPALFQLLEFALRSQERVIGTLVGTRSDDGGEIEIKDAYIVAHTEEDDLLEIEDVQNRAHFNLHKRSNPKDVVLGWFSTTDGIDSFTSLIHDFYSKSEQYPPIHLTLSSTNEIKDVPTVNTYVATTIGASTGFANILKLDKESNYIFTPIPNKINFDTQEKAVLNYASRAVFSENESNTAELQANAVDLQMLAESLNKIDVLIDNTLNYIEQVEQGVIKGNDKFAKLLLSNLNTNVKSLNLEQAFTSQIQDTLMVEYLASSIKTQLELSAKLAALA
jgi:translation initiation factor 3 subunit F